MRARTGCRHPTHHRPGNRRYNSRLPVEQPHQPESRDNRQTRVDRKDVPYAALDRARHCRHEDSELIGEWKQVAQRGSTPGNYQPAGNQQEQVG